MAAISLAAVTPTRIILGWQSADGEAAVPDHHDEPDYGDRITVTVQLLTTILRQARPEHGSFRSPYRSWDTTSRDATWERSWADVFWRR